MRFRLLTRYKRVGPSRYFMTSCSPWVRHKVQEPKVVESKIPWLDKIRYNTFLERYTYRPTFEQLQEEWKEKSWKIPEELKKASEKSVAVALKYMDGVFDDLVKPKEIKNKDQQLFDDIYDENYTSSVQFPYKIYTDYEEVESAEEEDMSSGNISNIEARRAERKFQSDMRDKLENDDASWIHDYGVPDPNSPPSDVPCGGCGAHLHCQDESIPGYMPSMRFKQIPYQELQAEICQRCYFLKVHDTALKTSVNPKEYPKILSQIKNKRALILLVVDLTDFPCSIWPGIADIIGEKRPVILVGNKVDLLPKDSKNYLDHVRKCLRRTAEDVGLNRVKIIDTQLISASTGYGVEQLISSMHNLWKLQDDVYIMGCTNVGKSTLFNVFLQSDLCKVKALDLVQRATVSAWPGTTLNLLKFPILRPDRSEIQARNIRLRQLKELEEEENKLNEFQLKETKNAAYSTLIGHVGRSHFKHSTEEMDMYNSSNDLFKVNPHSQNLPKLTQVGKWDPNDPAFAHGKWCYDTPGTVSENQILDELLLPELMHILPKTMIRPRTYYVNPGTTIFVGGLARIDYGEGTPIRYTVFSSLRLPITAVHTEHAEEVYEGALGTPVLGMPVGGKERLKKFPKLEASNFEVEGTGHTYSCCDLVISAAGWVAVTAARGQVCQLRVHTPKGAGIFCRQPALLPYMINLKGKRLKKTLAYGKHAPYVYNPTSSKF